ncbi:hypothetical protein ACOME3_002178 [Neoechinorhynchus agilis]
MSVLIFKETGVDYTDHGFSVIADYDVIRMGQYSWKGTAYNKEKVVVEQTKATPSTLKQALHELKMDVANQIIQFFDSSEFTDVAKNKVSLTFGATGGMRRLRDSKPSVANEIMGIIYDVFANSGYNVKTDNVRILSPQEEGLYEWMTTNGLAATANVASGDTTTVGVLHFANYTMRMGVIPLNYGSQTEIIPGSTSFWLFDEYFTAYSNSFDCLGAENLYLYFLKYLISKRNISSEEIENPCALKNDLYTINGTQLQFHCTDGFLLDITGVNTDKIYTITGTGNPDQCLSMVQSIIPIPTCNANSDTPF